MDFLIGIDDTDNLDSRGTGFRARTLGAALAESGLARLHSITRHQLLVHPDIRYTSHNSSACLLVDADDAVSVLGGFCRAFLLAESAAGSDAGLCIAARGAADDAVQAFGARAKREVLTPAEATALAVRAGLLLEGLTGDGGGVIGALAAVGLRATGDDGRCLWLPGLRELTGAQTVGDLCRTTGMEAVCTLAGRALGADAVIDLGDWARPVLRAGQLTLYVESAADGAGRWRVAPREVIKARSG